MMALRASLISCVLGVALCGCKKTPAPVVEKAVSPPSDEQVSAPEATDAAAIALVASASKCDLDYRQESSRSDEFPVDHPWHGRKQITQQELAELHARVLQLRPGMSWDAVMETLGLRRYFFFGHGWGGPDCFHGCYVFVRSRCSLDLEFDGRGPKGKFIVARLEHDWPDPPPDDSSPANTRVQRPRPPGERSR
jgi:hypothetical protein